ncbi:hypothetical protein QVD17_06904 [Tagetes erecta]|uniref:Uncharacterized protein n=1 Tax=Tagetes erecta TaxID=13708 RepID=A0AAD8LGF5_TARER|nr:hypothetical protein QVD17_06904 [Tagetes erecta]
MGTIFKARNPGCQETTTGDEGVEARPETSSGPKDSIYVDEGSLKQENTELMEQNLTLVKQLVIAHLRNPKWRTVIEQDEKLILNFKNSKMKFKDLQLKITSSTLH